MIKKEYPFIKKIKKLRAKDLPLTTEYLDSYEEAKLLEIKKTFDKKSVNKTEFLARFIYNSNAIDGNKLSQKDVIDIIDAKRIPKKSTLFDIQDVKNCEEAFYLLIKYKKDVNKKLIMDLHKLLLRKIMPEAGQLRDHDMDIYGSFYMPVGYDILPLEIEKFIQWYKTCKYHVFEKAALFHLKFVGIHPFFDGNGRLARLLHNFILWRNGYPMFVIPVKKKKKYFDAIEKSLRDDIVHPFIDFCKEEYF